MCDRKGTISFVTSGLAELLNHTVKGMIKMDIKNLMGQPWGTEHQRLMKETGQVWVGRPPLARMAQRTCSDTAA